MNHLKWCGFIKHSFLLFFLLMIQNLFNDIRKFNNLIHVYSLGITFASTNKTKLWTLNWFAFLKIFTQKQISMISIISIISMIFMMSNLDLVNSICRCSVYTEDEIKSKSSCSL
jgi:hypothetical protein